MKKLLVALLLSLELGSCTPVRHSGQAPRPWIHYYHRSSASRSASVAGR